MVKRNLIANYLGQGWVAVTGLAFVPVYVHYLGIESYGIIGLHALMQSLFVILDLGMTPTLSREMSRFLGGERDASSMRELLRTIEIIALAIGLIVATCVWLASEWLATSWLQANTIPTPVIQDALSVMGAVAALRFIEGIHRGSILGLQRHVHYNVINCIMATVRGGGAILVLAFFSPTVQAFFIWQGFASLIALITFAVYTYKCLPPGDRPAGFSFSSLQSIWRFAAGMVSITLLAMLLTQIDKVLLARLLPLDEYGRYTLMIVVASSLELLMAPVLQTFAPRLSQLHAALDEQRFAYTFHQGAQLISVTAGSMALILMTYPETVLALWTQNDALAATAAPTLRLLTLGYLLNTLVWMPYQAQLATRWTSLSVRINVIAVLIIGPALFFIVPQYGSIGAAWVWVTLNAGFLFVGSQFTYRRILIGERSKWYFGDIFLPLFSASIVAWTLLELFPIKSYGSTAQCLLLLAAGASVLLAACLSAPLIRQPIAQAVSLQWRSRMSGFTT